MHSARCSRRGTGRHRVGALVAVVAVLVGAAGCTSDDPPAVRTTVEKIWTAAGIDPVSAAANVGGVVVVYGTTVDGLLIYGLDPASGAQLWSRPAVLATDADRIDVGQAGDKVVYLRPTGTDRVSQLVIAEPRTGADLAVSSPRYWAATGTACTSPPAAVCATSEVQLASGLWEGRTFRVDEATGRTVPEGATDLGAGFSYPGNGDLRLNTVDDGPPVVARRVDGADAWTTPFADLFGSTMTSPGGLDQYDAADGTYSVVTVGTDWWNGTGQVDLARDHVTAGVSLADGSSRWIAPGTVLGCLGNHPMLDLDPSDEGESAAFRCRYTGSAVGTVAPPTGSWYVTSNLEVTVERFDPATGEVDWAAPVGAAPALAADLSSGRTDAIVDDTHLFIPTATGGVVLDLSTGKTGIPESAEVMWCSDSRQYDRVEPYIPDTSVEVVTARRSGVYRTCGSDGADAAVPTAQIPAEVSAAFDEELRVVSVNGAVSGFLAPPIADPAPPVADPPAGTPDGSAGPTPVPTTDPTTVPTTAASSPPTVAAPPPDQLVDAPTAVWTSTGFEPLTTPRIIGDTAVVYGAVGSDLYLFGLDPTSGDERWRQWASAAGLHPITPISVAEIDGAVAYLRPTESLDVRSVLVLADAATGADRLVADARWWAGFPTICEDDAAFLCGRSFEKADVDYTTKAVRIDRTTGSTRLEDSDPAIAQSPYPPMWGDLVEVRDAPVDTVGVLRDGALLWSAAVTELLGDGASLDALWLLTQRPGTPRVMSIAAPVGWQSDARAGYPTLDLAANLVTVGVNQQDGSVLWREPGTSTYCRARLGDPRLMSTPGSGYPALRCRYTGRLDSSPPGSRIELTVPTDLSVTLERFDLTTGRSIWSIPLGAQPALAVDGPGLSTILLDDHRMLFGDQVVDVATGVVRPPGKDETFWCPGRQTFRQSVVFIDRGVDRADRAAGGQVLPCDSRANPTTRVPGSVPLAVSAATEDGLRLVSTPGGVIAYRVPV